MSVEILTAIKCCEDRNIEGLIKVVPKLVDPNAIIFMWEKYGQLIKQASLLMISSYCGSIECVRYLIEQKADINRQDEVFY